jgi:hypothetical protein
MASSSTTSIKLGSSSPRPNTFTHFETGHMRRKPFGADPKSSMSELRGEVFEKSANSRLEISGSGAIFAHLVLCNIAVAMANPTGDRMVRFLRFHGSRTELEGLIMDFKTFLSAGYSKLTGQTSSSSLASLGKVADGDAASAAHEARLQAGYEAGLRRRLPNRFRG